jgi:hypothetical protein
MSSARVVISSPGSKGASDDPNSFSFGFSNSVFSSTLNFLMLDHLTFDFILFGGLG